MMIAFNQICAFDSRNNINSWNIPSDEKFVGILKEDSFAPFIKEHKITFVMFYAPWCKHTKKFYPLYSKLQNTMKTYNIPLVKVDATKEEDLAEKYGVSTYPHLILFKNSSPMDYLGDRTEE